jgi:RNA polymerase sigma factor (sigma-70 family)
MAQPDYRQLSDVELARSVARRDAGAFRHLMASCNQRLFRVARSLVASDHEAEDVVQEAYVTAYAKLEGFRGDCALLTWLTQIVLNEARQRLRDRKPTVDLEHLEAPATRAAVLPFPGRVGSEDPAASVANAELRRFLERAIDELPEAFRTVYMLRELEQCSVEETAALLGLRPETVKTRLHRARRLLRAGLERQVQSSLQEAFQFLGTRCARIGERVLARLGWLDGGDTRGQCDES